MKRRTFLKKAAIGGVAAAGISSVLAAPAISQGRKKLRMVTSWPKNFPGLGTAASRVAQQIEIMSGGKYSVKVCAGGELVHPLKAHDAVQQGTADMYHSADYYYQGKSKAYAFFAAVPFGMTANEVSAWIYHGGGQELWDELGASFGIKHLMAGNSGIQMGGWFKKKMNTLEDFKGLKMRIPGLGGDVINALGGTSLTLAGGEILPALQAGTIDATEWVGPWNDLAFGFYKVVKNYHYPGFHEPGTILSAGINKKLWDGMSKTDQAIIMNACASVNDYNLAEFNANNSAALETLVNKHGVKLHEFSDEIYKAIGKAALDVVESASKADAFTTKVYASYMKFRKIALGWSALSEQAYMNKRSLMES